MANAIRHLWYRLPVRLFLAELLEKRWMEPIIPFAAMCLLFAVFALAIPNYLSLINLQQLAHDFAEPGLVAVAMAFTILAGGIDLSVGASFALSTFVCLMLFRVLGQPLWIAALGGLGAGLGIGMVNGWLVAYVKTRPFLTTLAVLLIVRALFDLVTEANTADLANADHSSDVWEFLSSGNVLGVPLNLVVLLVVGLVAHVFLTRIRAGLHIMAVGASRKAARHAGINVSRTLLLAYLISGVVAAVAGVLYAARQNGAGPDTGLGWEVTALTAVVAGGISLAGGRGTIARSLIGSAIIFLLISGLLRLNVPGNVSSAALGLMLLVAVGVNVKWSKNRGKMLQKIYLNPVPLQLAPPAEIARGSDGPFAMNDLLAEAEPIGIGQIEGPEDVIVDRFDRVYGSTRDGWIVRFSGPNFSKCEHFARIGGRPLGMAFDRDDNLIVCVAGMGLYGVRQNGEVYKLSDETPRTWWRLKDDSRLSLADDLDIGPDGKIYFSEATVRYDMQTVVSDSIEGRGNGRLVCHDPATGKTRTLLRDLVFPNGVCLAHDGRSILICSTWACKVWRYWLDGPIRGKLEVFVDGLPGYPDNINRSSDGNYWLALMGLRAPALDLAMRHPAFRLRMAKQIPPDEWLGPNLNQGCVVKIGEDGHAIMSMWDSAGKSQPTVTSMREHKGWLYIGGLENNRIGRIKLEGADPSWTGSRSYWGERALAEETECR
ncbi:MAG: SMP-30/gluconolactonase/LRE family protein [Bradyrhizobium sp.]|nr:SMP-30/gluconolactonase/LRE family protein [Bradyrhizobium sp.]